MLTQRWILSFIFAWKTMIGLTLKTQGYTSNSAQTLDIVVLILDGQGYYFNNDSILVQYFAVSLI